MERPGSASGIGEATREPVSTLVRTIVAVVAWGVLTMALILAVGSLGIVGPMEIAILAVVAAVIVGFVVRARITRGR